MTYSNESGIDKYDGSFEKEESGCTIVVNQTIQTIKKLEVAGLYLYLMCRPPEWKLNVKHLASYFGCNKDKIYTLIDQLMDLNLLTRTELRNKGKFLSYIYRVHLKPKHPENTRNSPCLEKPEPVKPDTVNPDAYKTKKLTNKDLKKKKDLNNIPAPSETGSKKVIRDYEKDERFMRFYSAYPKKEDPRDAWKAFKSIVGDDDKLLEQIIADINNRKARHSKWQDKQYIKYPATYLRKGEYLSEIYNAALENEEKKKQAALLAKEREQQQLEESRKRQHAERLHELQKQSDAKAYRDIVRKSPSKADLAGLHKIKSIVGAN